MATDPSDSGGFDDTLPASGSSPTTKPIERIGRYRLERVLGKGGMGIVHAARDPDLDRLVALKVMHEPDHQARLVREAQAMAKLRHPNVLTVHDVGFEGDRVYITMELIEGTTLRAWQTAAPRTWREIVTMYVAAGRGLAAAHDAGIVHRDFNPGNVLVGKDGSVHVSDFGLARGDNSGPDDGSGSSGPSSESPRIGDPLTTVGTVVGTPAYMAPEQHDGETVGPTADQFAFAAAMWEALGGARPFAGTNIGELAVAKRDSRLGPTPRNAPSWLVALLRRGMRPKPDDRHASMAELVRALEHGLARRRHVMAIAAAAAAAAGVAALAIVLVATRSPSGPGCKLAGADVAVTWNDAARTRITAAFTGSNLAYAPDVLRRVLAELDRAAGALSSARIAACEATHAREKPSAEEVERRAACLDQRGNDLRAVVTLLGAGPDTDVIDHAYQSVVGIEDPANCAAVAKLELPQPGPTIRAQVDEERARLKETEARVLAGKTDAAEAAIDAHLARARELGFAPLLAEALIVRARIFDARENVAAALATYREAGEVGAAAHHDRVVAAALIAQLVLLEIEGKPADALQWMVAAEAAVARAGEPAFREDFLVARANIYHSLGRFAEGRADMEAALTSVEARTGKDSFETGRVASFLANALWDQGKSDEALVLDRRAQANWEKALGADHPYLGEMFGNTGVRLAAVGRFEEARAMVEHALSIKERDLGPEHASVATTVNNLAGIAASQHRDDEALAYYRRALAIREKALGPEHPLTAGTISNIGTQLERMGSYEQALAMHQRALAIREKVLGPDHPNTAFTLSAMAMVLNRLGRQDEALVAVKRAIVIREKALGEHPLTARSYSVLGNVLDDMGRTSEACAAHARALAMFEKALKPEHPGLVDPLLQQANCLLDRGKAREVLALAERAVSIAEKSDGDPSALPRARRVLAYALWSTGGDLARALQLARDAYASLADMPDQKANAAELAAWLKARHALPNPP